MDAMASALSGGWRRLWPHLPAYTIAGMLLGCSNGQDIVEPPPIAAVVTGRVAGSTGEGLAEARVTIRIDGLEAPAQTNMSSKDVVTTADGTFRATMLVGGRPEMDAIVHVIAAPPGGSGLAADSAAAPVRLKLFLTPGSAIDTVSVDVTLSPN